AIAYGYSNVFVTAPSPENLKSVFEFLISGLVAVKFKEHIDFEVIKENRGDAGSVVCRVNIFREHRQTVQYVLPTDHAMLAQAELLAIDEAAAIPLPVVQKLQGPYLVFMASTVNGYEGTGRSLSLKLIQDLRQQQHRAVTAAATGAGDAVAGAKGKKGQRKVHEERWRVAAAAASTVPSGARSLTELTLETPIRYGVGDEVEKWLNALLCLDTTAGSTRMVSGLPAPRDCDLYLVDRDALFSYHSMAEGLLQRIWALYTSAHYKNTPNDLQRSQKPSELPDILCVVQVAFEGRISQQSIQVMPTMPSVCPMQLTVPFADAQSMGYGSRALDLLISFFSGELGGGNVEYGVFTKEGLDDEGKEYEDGDEGLQRESITQKTHLPPLLIPLAERPAESLDWLGVSFGITPQLFNFWSRKGFKMCYLRQSVNELTGEHSTVMLREIDCTASSPKSNVSTGWLNGFVMDYRARMLSLLAYSFRSLRTSLALSLVDPAQSLTAASQGDVSGTDEATTGDLSSTGGALVGRELLTAQELTSVHLTDHDLKRLELYSRNMVDHHMIMDTVPVLSRLFFLKRLAPTVRLSNLQAAILLAVGLQHKDLDDLCGELNLPINQVLAFFNKTVRRLSSALRDLVESEISSHMTSKAAVSSMQARANAMTPAVQSLQDDQLADEEHFVQIQKQQLLMQHKDLSRHSMGGVEDDLLVTALERGIKKNAKNAIPKSISIPKRAPTDNGEIDSNGTRADDEKKRKKHGTKHPEKGGKKKKSRTD
ncbi:nat10, partial [Symbiodinium microadriaticum]